MGSATAHTASFASHGARRLWIVAALALAGLGVSVVQTQHFYEVRSGSASFSTFCNINEAMNCNAIDASRFSELVPGVPLSSFAAGWFLALFFVALLGRNTFWRRESTRAMIALSTVGVVFSAIYLLIMVSVIKIGCVLCLSVDAINLLLFGLILSLKPEGFKKHKLDPSKWKMFAGIVVGSLALGVGGLKTMDTAISDDTPASEKVDSVLSSPALPVNAGDEFPSFGPKNAPVTIVEFSDFECPYCRLGAYSVNAVLNRYPQQVRVVFRNYPLDMSCNRNMPRPLHEAACEAARAALCAKQQGKFEAVYETFFDKQPDVLPGKVVDLAALTGVDTQRLQGCMASPDTNLAIQRDIEEGTRLGVQSTPTFFINGHKVLGALSLPVWSKVIDRLLAGK